MNCVRLHAKQDRSPLTGSISPSMAAALACYCNSSVPGLKSRACDTIIAGASELLGPWTGGVGLGCGSAAVFAGFVNLFIHSKPTRSP